jgi:hypothetical protein
MGILYLMSEKTIENPCSTKTIDVLDRSALVKIAKKLNIEGSSNGFTKPYRKKEYIKDHIQKILKEKTIKKTVSENPETSYFKPVKKLVAIGDIHGDLSCAIKALKLAGVISMDIPNNTLNVNNIKWTGGETYVVQLGDQIDRCRPSNWVNDICADDDNELYQDEGSDLKIICLFNKLAKQAKKAGGAMISILGNHELMNVVSDFRYVSPREFREFGNYFKAKKTIKKSMYPFGYKERKEAFEPGGLIARKLAQTRFSIVQVGSWIFVHGGLVPAVAKKYSLDDINRYVRNWLVGSKDQETKDAIDDLYHNNDDSYSPFWSRVFSDNEEWDEKNSVKMFNEVMENVNQRNCRGDNESAKGMILGHSPQYMYDKGINSDCSNKLWRVDVGMSRAFGPLDEDEDSDTINRKVQVLLIQNDEKCKIIREE